MVLHGVFIGINNYRDPKIRDLRFARRDAEDLSQLFRECLGTDQIEVDLLTDELATRTGIMRAIGEQLPRRCSEEDLAVLYFSGHGTPETEGSVDDVSRYLVTHDTDYGSIYATGIDMQRDLVSWFGRLRARLVLLFLDTCFSGRSGGRTFPGPHLASVQQEFRGALPLSELNLGEGRLMVAACGEDEVASEDCGLKHGVFTYYLMQKLTGSAKQLGTISVLALYEQVAEAVRRHTSGGQTPVIRGEAALARLPILRTK